MPELIASLEMSKTTTRTLDRSTRQVYYRCTTGVVLVYYISVLIVYLHIS